MQVRRYDYAAQFDDIDTLLQELKSILLSGEYILTDDVRRFEEAFAAYLGVKHVCALNSGTDALLIGLRVLGVKSGDEVITPANTFYATVAAIVLAGATPVLVDADDETFLLDVGAAEAAVTKRTRVLLPVHLFGKPAPMASLSRIAAQRDLSIVEDAAQAHGASIAGRRAGSFGSLGCFSFHPSKNLSAAGDGGALSTNSDDIAKAVRAHRNLGQWEQNQHMLLGMNSKLDAIQAKILSSKLGHLDRWTESRNAVAARYREELRDLPLRFQPVAPDEIHAFHLFQVRCGRRDELAGHLREAGVDVVVRYPTPIHLQPAFADRGWRKGQFPVAERLADELLCLPIRPDMTESEIDYVSKAVHGFFANVPA